MRADLFLDEISDTVPGPVTIDGRAWCPYKAFCTRNRYFSFFTCKSLQLRITGLQSDQKLYQ